MLLFPSLSFFFFFNDTATTEIYTLSLHDALPISEVVRVRPVLTVGFAGALLLAGEFEGVEARLRDAERWLDLTGSERSEEHTSELQSRLHLVCRLLLEKKKNTDQRTWTNSSRSPA